MAEYKADLLPIPNKGNDNIKNLTFIKETDAINSGGGSDTVNLTNYANDVIEYILIISYNSAFQFSTIHVLPNLAGFQNRFWHYINGSSEGPLQAAISNDYKTLTLNNSINEAVKVRVYARLL